MALSKEEYERRKAAGLCVHCKAKAREGKSLCQQCFDKQMRYNRSRRKDQKWNQKDAEKKRTIREERKAKHLCCRCGKPLSDDWKYVNCAECMEKYRAACLKYYYQTKDLMGHGRGAKG